MPRHRTKGHSLVFLLNRKTLAAYGRMEATPRTESAQPDRTNLTAQFFVARSRILAGHWSAPLRLNCRGSLGQRRLLRLPLSDGDGLHRFPSQLTPTFHPAVDADNQTTGGRSNPQMRCFDFQQVVYCRHNPRPCPQWTESALTQIAPVMHLLSTVDSVLKNDFRVAHFGHPVDCSQVRLN